MNNTPVLIESGVPMPKRSDRRSMYPRGEISRILGEMKVGDSVVMERPWQMYLRQIGLRMGKVILTKAIPGTVTSRCWYVGEVVKKSLIVEKAGS